MSFNKKAVAMSIAMAISSVGLTSNANAAFKTNGEQAMYQLGACVAQKGQNQCGRQIQQACRIIASEAFKNAYTTRSLSDYYKNADARTRKEWERKTANLAMRQSGLGSPC